MDQEEHDEIIKKATNTAALMMLHGSTVTEIWLLMMKIGIENDTAEKIIMGAYEKVMILRGGKLG